MSAVKSLSVGEGDMFYIDHANNSFTMIDCCLSEENKVRIVDELSSKSSPKAVNRFISTHPDDDHIGGLEYLDQRLPILNFYCVKNGATKPINTTSFKHYCSLRDDSSKAYDVEKNCKRRWLNEGNEEHGASGIHFLWPDTSHPEFRAALEDARKGIRFNNISTVFSYYAANDTRFLWLGDLGTAYMEAIENQIELSKVHIVFAAHHGRQSGKIPNSWLDKLKPNIIVIGEAPSRHLHYYSGYNTITQNRAGDITFDCSEARKVHVYSSNSDYDLKYLSQEGKWSLFDSYLGTLNF